MKKNKEEEGKKQHVKSSEGDSIHYFENAA